MTDSQKWLIVASFLGMGWLIYLLAPILMPFAVGALLAYFADPLADRLEDFGVKRAWAVVIVFFIIVLALGLALLLLIPMLESQIGRLIDRLPTYIAWVKEVVIPWLSKRLHVNIQSRFLDTDRVAAILRDHWEQAGGVATSLLGSLSRSGAVLLDWALDLLLMPVVAFYLLRDWDVMVAHLYDLLPRRYAATVGRLASEADEVLGAFLRGQLSVMLALGAIYSTGLWLVGLDVAFLIGMIAGLMSFIPYVGTLVGVVTACIAALVQFQDTGYIVPVLIVFGIGQILEGYLLTPWLVGDKIGLHPVAVIFAVLAGGQLFGFLGVLLALPVASVIMVLIRHLHVIYKDSELYGHKVVDTLPRGYRKPEEKG
jgi:predicted PurR-regulated permease PerM